jgi:hypothetical protein
MEATLVIVTLLSLALAIGMAIVTWRLLQEERQRADARVAALEEGLAASLAANPPVSTPAPTRAPAPAEPPALTNAVETAPRASEASPHASLSAPDVDVNVAERGRGAESEVLELPDADDSDWLAHFPSSSGSAAREARVKGTIAHANGVALRSLRVRTADSAAAANPDAVAHRDAGPDATARIDFDLRNPSDNPTQPIAPVSTTDSFAAAAADRLFTEGDAVTRASERPRAMLAVGVGAGILALILVLWWVGRLIGPGIDPRTGGTSVATVAAAPLELVSLEQTRDGDALTIHGVVRNPHAGSTVDRLAAVVAFFDPTGKQLASVRAPLDFRTLAPGDESPFQVTTTVPAGVTRYRVSFRRDEGTIVPHVDRRQQEAS